MPKTRAELLTELHAADALCRRELSETSVDAYHAALIAFANSEPAAAPAPAPSTAERLFGGG